MWGLNETIPVPLLDRYMAHDKSSMTANCHCYCLLLLYRMVTKSPSSATYSSGVLGQVTLNFSSLSLKGGRNNTFPIGFSWGLNGACGAALCALVWQVTQSSFSPSGWNYASCQEARCRIGPSSHFLPSVILPASLGKGISHSNQPVSILSQC